MSLDPHSLPPSPSPPGRLSTQWLGLNLPHPIMPGASPLVDDLDTVMRLEDAGASAIVMHSLFEEQILREQLSSMHHINVHAESHAEALSYFPDTDVFALGPDAYLEQIQKIRARVEVPVIASLNGHSLGGWLEYARWMEQAGASALELNLYTLATDPLKSALDLEADALQIVRTITNSINIPVGVKLSPFYSSLPHFVAQLKEAGARGVLLFNRFYQADIDPELLELRSELQLSTSRELLMRLRWLAILSGRISIGLGCTGGVHTSLDAVKAIMAGAHVVQLTSALLQKGPGHLRGIVDGVHQWAEEHGYESMEQLRGCMDMTRCPDPSTYERTNYIKILQSWTR